MPKPPKADPFENLPRPRMFAPASPGAENESDVVKSDPPGAGTSDGTAAVESKSLIDRRVLADLEAVDSAEAGHPEGQRLEHHQPIKAALVDSPDEAPKLRKSARRPKAPAKKHAANFETTAALGAGPPLHPSLLPVDGQGPATDGSDPTQGVTPSLPGSEPKPNSQAGDAGDSAIRVPAAPKAPVLVKGKRRVAPASKPAHKGAPDTVTVYAEMRKSALALDAKVAAKRRQAMRNRLLQRYGMRPARSWLRISYRAGLRRA